MPSLAACSMTPPLTPPSLQSQCAIAPRCGSHLYRGFHECPASATQRRQCRHRAHAPDAINSAMSCRVAMMTPRMCCGAPRLLLELQRSALPLCASHSQPSCSRTVLHVSCGQERCYHCVLGAYLLSHALVVCLTYVMTYKCTTLV
jgi:hypothetical protein